MNNEEYLTNSHSEKNRAALISLAWTVFLVSIKLAAGIYTNSLGILSEALHSSLDLVAAAITWMAVRMAARPADKSHPYGYGKIENLSALVETVLLLVTCGWIIHEAMNRIFFTQVRVLPAWWGILIIVISLLVDLNRAGMLRRVANKYKSQALEADALHFQTDIWSSAVVLIGLVCLQITSFLPENHPLVEPLCMADAIAAFAVAGIVLLVSLRLSHRAVTTLLDGGGAQYADLLEKTLARELPLHRIRRLRVRESGAEIFMDIIVEAPASLNLEDAHEVSHMVENIAGEIAPGADVTVHVEPASEKDSSPLHLARSLAAARGLSVHNMLFAMQQNGSHVILLHVEAPANLDLAEAHARVDDFENALEKELHGVTIITHIEPDSNADPISAVSDKSEIIRLYGILQEMRLHFPIISALYDVRIFHLDTESLVSFHCALPGKTSLEEAHMTTSALEMRLRKIVPNLDQVVIHTDPEEERRTE